MVQGVGGAATAATTSDDDGGSSYRKRLRRRDWVEPSSGGWKDRGIDYGAAGNSTVAGESGAQGPPKEPATTDASTSVALARPRAGALARDAPRPTFAEDDGTRRATRL